MRVRQGRAWHCGYRNETGYFQGEPERANERSRDQILQSLRRLDSSAKGNQKHSRQPRQNHEVKYREQHPNETRESMLGHRSSQSEKKSHQWKPEMIFGQRPALPPPSPRAPKHERGSAALQRRRR